VKRSDFDDSPRANGLSAGRKRLNNWFSGLGDRLVAVDVEGTMGYVVREDLDALETAPPSEAVRFLPGHDQWVRAGLLPLVASTTGRGPRLGAYGQPCGPERGSHPSESAW
jgi:hypothetical protein